MEWVSPIIYYEGSQGLQIFPLEPLFFVFQEKILPGSI